MRGWVVLGVIYVGAASSARADDVAYQRWPALPPAHGLTLDEKMVDHVSDLGNQFGDHLNVLSHDLLALRIDMRFGRARIRVGGGDVHYLTFRFDSDWYFADNKATVNARLDLGISGHMLHLQLPTMEVIPDSYHGQQLVQLNVPLLQRRF
jgi:hypothetical protein